jgi:hypothetical protein
MNEPTEEPVFSPKQSETPGYESPGIERVLTPDEMEREVLFAGPFASDAPLPPPG